MFNTNIKVLLIIVSILFIGCESTNEVNDLQNSRDYYYLNYVNWKYASAPGDNDLLKKDTYNLKFKVNWQTKENTTSINFNSTDYFFPAIEDIQHKYTLEFNCFPYLKAEYVEQFNDSDSWGGAMINIPHEDREKISKPHENSLIIILKIPNEDNLPKFRINIDLGLISEDVIINDILDTEDINANYLLDKFEDTGLDGKMDIDEVGYNQNNTDPNSDNYSYGIYGTEGNGSNPDFPNAYDTEDINKNTVLDTYNSYFSYARQVESNLNGYTDMIRLYTDDNSNNFFGLIDFPLLYPVHSIGNPDYDIVETMRLYFSNLEYDFKFEVVYIGFEKNIELF